MITSISQKITLNDQTLMPGYGFGLYKAQGDELSRAIQTAYDCGYRLYDTAAFYQNEDITGHALARWPREDFYLVSKIWPTDFSHPVRALDQSLARLGQEYLNAYLLHWPGTDERAMLKCWEALTREQEKGKIISLGASNFLAEHLRKINAEFGVWPPMNQIEAHPRYQQPRLCDFCAAKGIAVMAWSPIGRGSDLDNPELVKIAQDTGKTTAQVILRWHVQHNRVPLPKSVHADRIRSNADIFGFTLTAEQMRAIDNLDQGLAGRRGADPLVFGG